MPTSKLRAFSLAAVLVGAAAVPGIYVGFWPQFKNKDAPTSPNAVAAIKKALHTPSPTPDPKACDSTRIIIDEFARCAVTGYTLTPKITGGAPMSFCEVSGMLATSQNITPDDDINEIAQKLVQGSDATRVQLARNCPEQYATLRAAR